MRADNRFATVNPISGIRRMGEDARRAETNIVVEGHSDINGYVVLHFDVITQIFSADKNTHFA